MRAPFNQDRYNALLPLHPYVTVKRDHSGLRGLGFSVGDGSLSGGSIDINTDTGAWSVNDPAAGVAVASGTSPMIAAHCPDPVPFQNAITTYILAPISAQVSQVPNNLNYADLQMLQNALLGTQANWLAYLHQTNCLANADWAKRSRGAEATLNPYFTGLNAKIMLLMNTASSGGSVNIPSINAYPIPGAPAGTYTGLPGSILGQSPTTLALIAVAAYFLLKK